VGGLLMLAVLGLLLLPVAAADQSEKNKALLSNSADASKYTGAETYKTCHEDLAAHRRQL